MKYDPLVKFLKAKKVRHAECFRRVSKIYNQNAISEGTVRKLCWQCNESKTNVHGEERSGKSTVVTENLIQQINERIRGQFTVTELADYFSQISRKSLLRSLAF